MRLIKSDSLPMFVTPFSLPSKTFDLTSFLTSLFKKGSILLLQIRPGEEAKPVLSDENEG